MTNPTDLSTGLGLVVIQGEPKTGCKTAHPERISDFLADEQLRAVTALGILRVALDEGVDDAVAVLRGRA